MSSVVRSPLCNIRLMLKGQSRSSIIRDRWGRLVSPLVLSTASHAQPIGFSVPQHHLEVSFQTASSKMAFFCLFVLLHSVAHKRTQHKVSQYFSILSGRNTICQSLIWHIWVDSHLAFQGQEVLSPLTALMQEPRSPEARKPVMGGDSNEYAQLVRYAIVFEHKSAVWGYQFAEPSK